ncbi:MAG TPA: DUF6542 domain-containing protein [Nocardioidaceae bacterium]|nr:DUF6542 domain-containing protein [Nocardioidaceae bacterium]
MSDTRSGTRPRASAPARTLWEEGRRPGRQVVTLSTISTFAVAALNLALTDELTLFFDLTFVVLCLVAALAVRPRDFFAVGVLPPLLMLCTVTALAVFARPAVADEEDSVVQAVVSGLAHHAGALVAGYVLALGILALRQVALRNSGHLRTYA